MSASSDSLFSQLIRFILSAFLTILLLIAGTAFFFKIFMDWLAAVLILSLAGISWLCIRGQQKAIGWGIVAGLGIALFILIVALSGLNYVR
ncbi:hypothetical protein [Xanthocytophaga agilis]|uniref:Uncharacterized protein n=1 Tax=Xanthocytophaga agilis TaxID=3048010 RepID=A0AAE3R7Y7_9BACT|nr:hypothetical protein [Xanthocytophaga agilis]MDJ1505341.1 hypothetical protein [Xanthocytophaga agilis]